MLFSVAMGIILLFPQFIHTEPNIDTLTDVYNSSPETISYYFTNFTARYKPLWNTFVIGINTICSYQIQRYFIVYSILFGLIVFFQIKICKLQLHSVELVLIPILLLLSNITVATFWRLGAVETLFTCLLMISFYAYAEKKHTLVIFMMLLMISTKETSLFVLPVFTLLYIIKKNHTMSIIMFMLLCINFLIVQNAINIFKINPENYEIQFSFTISHIIEQTTYWFYETPMLFITTIGNFIFILHKFFTKKSLSTILNTSYIYIESILLFLPFIFFERREQYYIFPAYACSVLYIIKEISLIKRFEIKLAASICILISIVVIQPTRFLNQAIALQESYKEQEMLVRFGLYNSMFRYRSANNDLVDLVDWINKKNNASPISPIMYVTFYPFTLDPHTAWSTSTHL